MDEEEEITGGDSETYDLMLQLERLESLREDIEEAGFNSLPEVEAALALAVPGADATAGEKRALLTSIRSELLELGLSDLEEVETQIEELNNRLDELDEDF